MSLAHVPVAQRVIRAYAAILRPHRSTTRKALRPWPGCVYTLSVFEWDPGKAAANLVKHGVSFDEAVTAFEDPNGLDGVDVAHSADEPRRLRLAASSAGRVLVVAYTMRKKAHEEITRIISAGAASQRERKRYQAPED